MARLAVYLFVREYMHETNERERERERERGLSNESKLWM